MIKQILAANKFESKAEVAAGFDTLFQPLTKYFSTENPGYFKLGSHGTVYSESRQQVEAYLRPLWGMGPYLVDHDSPYIEQYLAGIVAGTDPKSPHYWGEIENYDQLIVEMASLSTMLLLVKDKTWSKFSEQEQKNLHQWLIQVNEHKIPRNNWLFFRVLVNLAMKKCEMPFSQEQMNHDLATIDTFYQGEGWYCDGFETQLDYYVSFAIHYYSLLYCHFMEEEDPERVTIMKERALLFAQSFKYWFDARGEALPFGRSLSYRFAQVSFFSALVFANVEALPWGEVKGLISRHLQQWMTLDITTPAGLLSVGYHYQNLVFAEGYNGPGSPYWSFKTFLLLAVPEEHPYWQATAQPLKIRKNPLPVPESRNFYQYNKSRDHLLAFPAGQFVKGQSHASAKYSKFVYSSIFGFSVPKSTYAYYEGGFDNCLALAEEDHYFRAKDLDTAYEIREDRVIHQWFPWSNVSIKSTILPLENGHVRIHEIETERELSAYEGGFSSPAADAEQSCELLSAVVKAQNGISSVEGIYGYKEAGVVKTEANTNLFYPTAVLPYVKTTLAPGKHILISLISGRLPQEEWIRPEIQINENRITIVQGDQERVALLGYKD